MTRRKRKEQKENITQFTVDEVLDQAEEAGLKNCIIVGVDENENLALLGTITTAGFFHHMLNRAIFIAASLEENNIAQRQKLKQVKEEEKSSVKEWGQ